MTQNNAEPILKILQDLPNVWFPVASIYNAVAQYNYATIPGEYQQETKSKVDTLTVGLIIIYLFSLFESYISWNNWKIYDEEYAIRLRAYRHIRHSFAHSPDGKRAIFQYKDFDLIMHSQNPLKGVTIEDGSYVRADIASIEELIAIMIHIAHLFIRDTKILEHSKLASLHN